MSVGLSVIAPRKAFSQELLANSGWYFESGSVADLFRVFVQAIREPENRVSKIQTGIVRSKVYSLELNTPRFVEYLKAV